MFKKTFYTVLAIGAIVIIGSVTSGFMSTTATTGTSAETAVEAETTFAAGWYIGTVAANGSKKDSGTGNWAIKRKGQGQYEISAFSDGAAGTVVVTPIAPAADYYNVYDEKNGYSATVIPGRFAGIYTVYIRDGNQLKDGSFSFIMYAK